MYPVLSFGNSASEVNFNAECAVRPPSKRVAAIPDVAISSAILFCDLIVARIIEIRKVLPVHPGASKKYCHTHNLLQVPIAELAERWTELPQVSDESRSFFRVHTGYFSNIPKCIKAEFIASWACSQSSVVSSSQR
ncbi:hypothetical protein TNCV_2694371 [Trichonephila clavipes]|nr:hypothetical protein TNCV_2694371 [Trichonephila clavipes]